MIDSQKHGKLFGDNEYYVDDWGKVEAGLYGPNTYVNNPCNLTQAEILALYPQAGPAEPSHSTPSVSVPFQGHDFAIDKGCVWLLVFLFICGCVIFASYAAFMGS